MKFQPQYSEEHRDKRERDRFQVETDKEFTRELFEEMQITMQQPKDATALKQWAMYGYLAFSNPSKANMYILEAFSKNKMNNKRLGLNVKDEIRNKFQSKNMK